MTKITKSYVIYSLVDPRDGLSRYVGITNDLLRRLHGHAMNGESRTRSWIMDLEVEGLLPIIRILGRGTDPHECGERESAWIRKLFVEGHPLTNRRSLYDSKTGELCPPVQHMLADRQQ